jgi:hypothetical protein
MPSAALDGMKSTDHTPAQCQAIRKRLRTTMVYLAKLEDGMERDFSGEDRLFPLVQQAHDAVREVFLKCHELGSGRMGRKSSI